LSVLVKVVAAMQNEMRIIEPNDPSESEPNPDVHNASRLIR